MFHGFLSSSVTEPAYYFEIKNNSEIIEYDDMQDWNGQATIQSQILDLCSSFVEIRPSILFIFRRKNSILNK